MHVSCEECKKWKINLRTGEKELYAGKPLAQHPSGPPCIQEPGICPKGAPGKSDLTPQNQMVLRHFEQCRAVGEFPDDPIVQEHAMYLEAVYSAAERKRDNEELSTMLARIMIRRKR